MTGAANEVNRLLKKLDTGPKANRFLRHLEDLTFGQAGFHQQWGHEDPGTWCWFDLSSWARELGLSSSAIIHQRDRLVAQRIIWYEPELEMPGRGRIGWNLNFATWRPLQSDEPHWGGKRRGAGRPKKSAVPPAPNQPIIDILKSKQDAVDILNNAQRPSIDILIAQQGGVDILNNFGDFKISTGARFDAAPRLGLLDLLRKDTLRRDPDIQIESNDSTADAVDTAPLGSVLPLTSGQPGLDDAALISAAPIDGAPSCSQWIYEITSPLQRTGSAEPPPDSAAAPPVPPLARARAATRAARKPAAKAPAAPRALTPDQQYRYDLLSAISEALDGAKTPNWGRDWKAAGWFYTKARQHPANIDAVVACYREMKQVPDWQVEYLHLDRLTRHFDAYQKNPANFHAWVVKQIKTDEWVRRKQHEEASGITRRPISSDALNPSVASTPSSIPTINPSAELARDLAAWEAHQRAQQQHPQQHPQQHEAIRLRMRQIAQRAGCADTHDADTNGL